VGRLLLFLGRCLTTVPLWVQPDGHPHRAFGGILLAWVENDTLDRWAPKQRNNLLDIVRISAKICPFFRTPYPESPMRQLLFVSALCALLPQLCRADDEAEFKAEALKFIREAKGLIKLFDDTNVTLGAFKEKRRKVLARYADVPDAPEKFELTGKTLKLCNSDLESAEVTFEIAVKLQGFAKDEARLEARGLAADLAGTKEVLKILERVLKASKEEEAAVFTKAKDDLLKAMKDREARIRSRQAEREKLLQARKAASEAQQKAKAEASAKAKAEAEAKKAAEAKAAKEKEEAEAKAAQEKKEAEEKARQAALKRQLDRIKKAKETARIKEEEAKEREKKEAPIRAEKSAAAKLKLIKRLLDEDREKFKDKAILRLEQLVKQFPKTKAAAEARKLLKELDPK
jgi:hypothetical protein